MFNGKVVFDPQKKYGYPDPAFRTHCQHVWYRIIRLEIGEARDPDEIPIGFRFAIATGINYFFPTIMSCRSIQNHSPTEAVGNLLRRFEFYRRRIDPFSLWILRGILFLVTQAKRCKDEIKRVPRNIARLCLFARKQTGCIRRILSR